MVTSDDLQPRFHPGQVLVRFRGESRARVVSTAVPVQAVQRFRADPAVLYAELDYVVSIDATIPNDPLWSEQWDMTKIAAPQSWDQQTGASDVVVAVIDTGIDLSHPDLRANLWTGSKGERGYSCSGGTCRAGGQDDHGHGTHVAGTIGASANNGIGMAGVNWDVQLLALKVLDKNGGGYASDAIAAFAKVAELRRAGVNVRVTNSSWGGGEYSQALVEAMLEVEALGVVNVCAAGNNGNHADVSPAYPGAYPNRGIISVLASDKDDAGASFTNYGLASVDIAAPGVSTLSTVPTGSCALCAGSGYRLLSGTSMATPHVAGVVAALLSKYPALDAAQARDAILHPASYDVLKDPLARLTSSAGRLNMAKVLANPFNANPSYNRFPAVSVPSSLHVAGGTPVNLKVTASDADGDALRSTLDRVVKVNLASNAVAWALRQIIPSPTSSSVSFTAPRLARTAVVRYVASVADGRGGGTVGNTDVTIHAGPAGGPPSGSFSVSPTSGPAGMSATINYAVSDPEKQLVGWELSISGKGGTSRWCCFTTPKMSVTFREPGVYRVGVDAIDAELQQTGNRQTAVVTVGNASGTPPVADLALDKLSGPVPLTVTATSQSYNPGGGQVTTAIIGDCRGTETATCTFDTPGVYSIVAQAKNKNGLLDWVWTSVVAHPPSSTPAPPPPDPAPSPTAPTVAIASPVDGATVPRRSTVAVVAEAQTASTVNRVDLFVDGKLLCTSTALPYTCTWTVPAAPKSYSLQAVATDAGGTVGYSAIVRVTAH